MKRIPFILLMLLSLLALALPNATAQSDTLSDLRLFQKAATSDSIGDNVAANHTSAQATDSAGEKIRILESLYSAGKYNQVLTLSRQIQEQHDPQLCRDLQTVRKV